MAQLKVFAPLDGELVELEKVPDEVFAEKMVGDGVAIDPTGLVAVSPVNGTLVKLFETGHAFGVATDSGVELIVHIGLDTVELNGQGFEKIATEGQAVQVGTPIVRYDRNLLANLARSVLSPVVLVSQGTLTNRATGVVQAGRDVLFTIEF